MRVNGVSRALRIPAAGDVEVCTFSKVCMCHVVMLAVRYIVASASA